MTMTKHDVHCVHDKHIVDTLSFAVCFCECDNGIVGCAFCRWSRIQTMAARMLLVCGLVICMPALLQSPSHTSLVLASSHQHDGKVRSAKDLALKKFKQMHRGRIVQETPYVRFQPAEVRVSGTCSFDGCPAGHPFVYFMTSYRNRGASFNRWVRSVLSDVQSDVNTHPVQCVCMAVADYNDVLSGVPLEAALSDWPYSKAVISLHGAFSRAGGFQR